MGHKGHTKQKRQRAHRETVITGDTRTIRRHRGNKGYRGQKRRREQGAHKRHIGKRGHKGTRGTKGTKGRQGTQGETVDRGHKGHRGHKRHRKRSKHREHNRGYIGHWETLVSPVFLESPCAPCVPRGPCKYSWNVNFSELPHTLNIYCGNIDVNFVLRRREALCITHLLAYTSLLHTFVVDTLLNLLMPFNINFTHTNTSRLNAFRRLLVLFQILTESHAGARA